MWVEVLLFGLFVLLLRYYTSRPRNMPPGPMVIPFMGNTAAMEVDAVKKYREKYGDIFKTEMGPTKFIFICNYKLIKETLSRPEVADRPFFEMIFFLTDGVPTGVVNTNGQHWQNARRFLLRNLRDLGMGKTYLEEAIHTEAAALVEDFKKNAGVNESFPKSLNVAVLNVVWQMVASTRYDLDDERVMSIVNILRTFDGSSSLALVFEFIPFLKKIVPAFIRNQLSLYKTLNKLGAEGRALMKDLIASHRAKLDPDNPRDVIDEYLLAMDNKSDMATFFSETDLLGVTFDLFNAGFDTVSTMLRWIILYMAKYQDVQRRVQEQIDEVVPRDTLPSYEHKSKLPLVEAMIHEALRFSSMIPMGAQRSNSVDIEVGGYLVPKDSFIFGVTICCHENPQHWDQPDQFRPERFLDENGNFVSQKEGFLPFGIGRRSCLGEALARMELYLFSAALLQNLTFSTPDGVQVNLDPSPRMPSARFPIEQQQIVITPRTRKD